MIKVTVQRVFHNRGESITIAEGIDEAGNKIRFAGDWRPLREIAEAIKQGEEPEVEVPDWAVLG
jgi:hypothetical protein